MIDFQSTEFYDCIERELYEFAAFYRLDMPSVKSAVFELMRQVGVQALGNKY